MFQRLHLQSILEMGILIERYNQEYRDLYLDLRRAQYELEVASDLGDAMVSMSALRYRVMRAEFATALAWARIDALLGRGDGADEKLTTERVMDASADR